MLLLLLLLLRFLFMLPLFVLIIADVGAVPAGAAAAPASDLVLLFGSSIRHPAVAGRGTRDAMAETWFGYDGAERWELQWDTSIMRKGYSQYGTSGFARVISRSSGAAIAMIFIRAHLCKHNPCRADWTHDTKYGPLPRPFIFNFQKIGECLLLLLLLIPLPQSCTGILRVHRWGQKEATMMLQKEMLQKETMKLQK